MEFNGRFITRNGTLVAVHKNPGATEGNRVERYLGHSIPIPSQERTGDFNKDIELIPFKICWNENGEAVWLQGIVDSVSKYDLMQSIEGNDSYRWEKTVKADWCKECKEK